MAENKQLVDRIVQDIQALYSADPKSAQVEPVKRTIQRPPFLSRDIVADAVIEQVAQTFFAEHAKWSDPMLIVRGRDAIQTQFSALRLAFRQIDVTVHSANVNETGVAIDMTVNYFPRLLPDFCKIPIRQWTTLTLNSQKEVILQSDRWSVLDILSDMKGVGCIYDCARWVVGRCVTMVCRQLQCIRAPQTVQI